MISALISNPCPQASPAMALEFYRTQNWNMWKEVMMKLGGRKMDAASIPEEILPRLADEN